MNERDMTNEERIAVFELMQAWCDLSAAVDENDVVKWYGAMLVIEKHLETRIGNTLARVMALR